MNDFDSFMGFSTNEMEQAEHETGNLTAGVYNMMIERVTFMCRPSGQAAYAVDVPAQAGADLTIEILCVLAEETNGFASGWKHTIFLRPAATNNVTARISKAQMSQIFKATGVQPSTDMANALVGKMIELELAETVSKKDGNRYVNVKEIRAIGAKKAAPAKKAADNEPNWNNTKMATPAAKPAAKTPTPSDWE